MKALKDIPIDKIYQGMKCVSTLGETKGSHEVIATGPHTIRKEHVVMFRNEKGEIHSQFHVALSTYFFAE